MSRLLCFKLLKEAIMKNTVKGAKKEELCKVGAKNLSLILTNDVVISGEAYDSSNFNVGKDVHSIRCHTNGIEHWINDIRAGTIKQSTIDEAMSMDKAARKRMLATVKKEVETQRKKDKKIKAQEEQDAGDAVLDGVAEVGKNKEGEDITVFNQFIDKVMEKIPPNTAIAASLTYNFWANLALEVAHDRLMDYEIVEEDGPSKLIRFMDEKLSVHDFVMKQKGFLYRVDDEERSFKGYDEIASDFMEKGNN